jgi:hypothetical protein
VSFSDYCNYMLIHSKLMVIIRVAHIFEINDNSCINKMEIIITTFKINDNSCINTMEIDDDNCFLCRTHGAPDTYERNCTLKIHIMFVSSNIIIHDFIQVMHPGN